MFSADLLQRLGIHALPRRSDLLKEKAARITGLSDFGPKLFMDAYEILFASMRDEAQLHGIGERIVTDTLLNNLCNRLRIEETRRTHPEIERTSIARPIIILGLPRTGSTFLQRLLAADSVFHHLRFQEALMPAPPPALTPELADRRRAYAQFRCERSERFVPSLNQMHRITPDSPEECYFLLRNAFMHPSYHLIGPIPAYINFLNAHDRTSAYEDYAYQLKILQFGRPHARWVLKGPAHWQHIAILHRLFPDAHFIQTHRHPRAVLRSWIQLYEAILKLHSRFNMPLAERAQISVRALARHVEFLHTFRTENPAAPFHDVHYKDLTRDPLDTARRIYLATGQPWTESSQAALTAFLEHDRRDRKDYTPKNREPVGPTDHEINEHFAAYLARNPGL